MSARGRVFRGVAVLGATALPWVGLALLSRGMLPGDESWIRPLLGVTLVGTYAGAWICAMVMSRHPRRMGLRALTATIGVLASIVVLELPAIFRVVHWRLLFKTVVGEGADYGTTYVLDADLGFRRIPNLRWSGRPLSDVEEAYGLPRSLERPITFSYDRWGYRNASDMEQADVVLLGDSYVEGWYVSDEETVSSRLAARLGKPVASLAVAGYGPLQELRVLKGDALKRRPKVVAWFFFEGNDLYDDQRFEDERLGAPPRGEETSPQSQGLTRHDEWRKRSFVLNAFHLIRRRIHPLIPNRAPYWARLPRPGAPSLPIYFFNYGGVPWTDYEEDRWRTTRAAFEEGVAFARQHGIQMVFLYVPIKYRVFRDFIEIPEGSPMERWDVWHLLPVRFQDFCTTSSVPCVDLTGPLKDAVRQGVLSYPPSDTHWSPEGHAVAAAALEEVLRKNGW